MGVYFKPIQTSANTISSVADPQNVSSLTQTLAPIGKGNLIVAYVPNINGTGLTQFETDLVSDSAGNVYSVIQAAQNGQAIFLISPNSKPGTGPLVISCNTSVGFNPSGLWVAEISAAGRYFACPGSGFDFSGQGAVNNTTCSFENSGSGGVPAYTPEEALVIFGAFIDGGFNVTWTVDSGSIAYAAYLTTGGASMVGFDDTGSLLPEYPYLNRLLATGTVIDPRDGFRLAIVLNSTNPKCLGYIPPVYVPAVPIHLTCIQPCPRSGGGSQGFGANFNF